LTVRHLTGTMLVRGRRAADMWREQTGRDFGADNHILTYISHGHHFSAVLISNIQEAIAKRDSSLVQLFVYDSLPPFHSGALPLVELNRVLDLLWMAALNDLRAASGPTRVDIKGPRQPDGIVCGQYACWAMLSFAQALAADGRSKGASDLEATLNEHFDEDTLKDLRMHLHKHITTTLLPRALAAGLTELRAFRRHAACLPKGSLHELDRCARDTHSPTCLALAAALCVFLSLMHSRLPTSRLRPTAPLNMSQETTMLTRRVLLAMQHH
jgi:hypothetical protein